MEYRYSPKPQNKNATYLTVVLGLLSLLMLALGMGNVLEARTLWHFLFLVLIVATLFLFLRYFSSCYLYVISEEWGEPTLVVYHVQGKRLSAQCRLALSHLLRVVEVPDERTPEGQAALREYAEERRRYAYRATLGAAATQILYGIEGRERFALRIEGDAAFMEALRAAQGRALHYAAEHGVEEDEDADE